MFEEVIHDGKNGQLDAVTIDGEQFFKISNVDEMRPFFMSVVSDSDHWMFISSNGGLAAGRKNTEYALFPYYTDDKITESADTTGSKTIFQVSGTGAVEVWEPFSARFTGKFRIIRNLYKSAFGNKILFEEVNEDLKLVFQYQWNFSNEFGFVKKSRLVSFADGRLKIKVLDGIQNLVTYGVGSDLQIRASNLADAYKRSELDKASGLGIYALSAIIVDKAEPSEALKANVAFCLGLENTEFLLSSLQVNHFRKGGDIIQEEDVKGEKGAYFVRAELDLAPQTTKTWMIVANVNQNHAGVTGLIESIKGDKNLGERIRQDIDAGTENLVRLVASADGLQVSADVLQDARHFSNVLFNIMRGGIFDDNYRIDRQDFMAYLEKANRPVFAESETDLHRLPAEFSHSVLSDLAEKTKNADFIRLATEYLPLKFSRRHGDPSRPWNKFSINTRSESDGSKILDYEGNWRDIFQNWEALAHSYPEFIGGMIFKFLNASTFDGYNPYRITKDGFDWETIEPDDPWSYIGYWGDHQLIYLLKFLEFAREHSPNYLDGLLNKEYFVYANVPYKIKPYADILKNPKDTIDFDFELDEKVRERRDALGADGALLQDAGGAILHVSFTEKILATVLAKLSNFIVEGGIWMNTQRPEWNDANNALVGNGVSVVTLCYLGRFMQFFKSLLSDTVLESVNLSVELADFYSKVRDIFEDNKALPSRRIGDEARKNMLDCLGQAASDFRQQVYAQSFQGQKRAISLDALRDFADLSLAFIEHSIRANKREDNLYHGYNLMTADAHSVSIAHLDEMLEGQVAALSSGLLPASESLQLLDALKKSALFREDQYSYLLYPNKNLPGFLQKNTITGARLEQTGLLKNRAVSDFSNILQQDVLGQFHFNGNFKNARDLEMALDAEARFDTKEKEALLQLFEAVFHHKAFTGRSGMFFGYEGLGSIYWHMVSKLRLAVLETCLKALEEKAGDRFAGGLSEHYYAIVEGIGVHKSPVLYGAFPTDPYSHTPLGRGAQQPGMTGQVKEDILCRWGELGVFLREGQMQFRPALLRRREFLKAPKDIAFFDVHGHRQQLTLKENTLFFTCCQVPVVYELADRDYLAVDYSNGNTRHSDSPTLTEAETRSVCGRNGDIRQIRLFVNFA